jgi:hypothetical protein
MDPVLHGVEVSLYAVEPFRKIRDLQQPSLAIDVEHGTLVEERTHAGGEIGKRIRLRCRRDRCAAGAVHSGDGRRADALRGDIVDVEDACLGLAPKDTNHPAVNRVVKAERPEHERQRLPNGDVLQLADERPFDPRIDDDAEARAADEEQQDLPHGEGLRERQEHRSVVEVSG